MEKNPIQLFQSSYAEAKKDATLDEDAIALATVDRDGRPDLRVVYFRRLIDEKFCFFTNYDSAKGHDLALHPWATILFLWHPIGKQVRVRGPVTLLDAKDSDAYFNQRDRESQISASVSKQSRELKNFESFLEEIEAFKKKIDSATVARPKNWGGYALDPQSIEFWERGEHRRHRRELYERTNGGWNMKLLYP